MSTLCLSPYIISILIPLPMILHLLLGSLLNLCIRELEPLLLFHMYKNQEFFSLSPLECEIKEPLILFLIIWYIWHLGLVFLQVQRQTLLSCLQISLKSSWWLSRILCQVILLSVKCWMVWFHRMIINTSFNFTCWESSINQWYSYVPLQLSMNMYSVGRPSTFKFCDKVFYLLNAYFIFSR